MTACLLLEACLLVDCVLVVNLVGFLIFQAEPDNCGLRIATCLQLAVTLNRSSAVGCNPVLTFVAGFDHVLTSW